MLKLAESVVKEASPKMSLTPTAKALEVPRANAIPDANTVFLIIFMKTPPTKLLFNLSVPGTFLFGKATRLYTSVKSYRQYY
jgi:hypothetical protein